MTNSLTDAIEAVTVAVKAIKDPAERFRAARDRREEIGDGDQALLNVQRAAIWDLYETKSSWRQVGEELGFSGSRAEAIARGR